jgi:hypothetical protein
MKTKENPAENSSTLPAGLFKQHYKGRNIVIQFQRIVIKIYPFDLTHLNINIHGSSSSFRS